MSSLKAFGVSLSADEGRGGILQPKQTHRFRVIFDGFVDESRDKEMTQQVMTCTRPNARRIGNDILFDPIKITLRDDITDHVLTAVSQRLHRESAHPEDRFNMEIDHMDGADGVLSTFEIRGAYLSRVEFSEGDYADGKPMTVTLTIEFESAVFLSC